MCFLTETLHYSLNVVSKGSEKQLRKKTTELNGQKQYNKFIYLKIPMKKWSIYKYITVTIKKNFVCRKDCPIFNKLWITVMKFKHLFIFEKQGHLCRFFSVFYQIFLIYINTNLWFCRIVFARKTLFPLLRKNTPENLSKIHS